MLDAYEYIHRDSPDAAERFLDACEHTFELLARNPRAGRLRPELGSKRLTVRSFPVHRNQAYLVIYRVARVGVVIIRVLHGARDLGASLRGGPG